MRFPEQICDPEKESQLEFRVHHDSQAQVHASKKRLTREWN
jgi:hypothetical protein